MILSTLALTHEGDDVAKPGPKETPLDDPVAEAKRQRRLAQRRASYWRNHEKQTARNNERQRERRSRTERYESEKTHYFGYKYGIKVEDYNRMLVEQDGKCAACGTTEVRNGKTRFDIDHNHETGEVRGLLCGHCNRAWGMLGDSVDRVTMLLAYAMSFENVLEQVSANTPSSEIVKE